MKDYPGFLEVNSSGEPEPELFGATKQTVYDKKKFAETYIHLKPGAHVISVVITDNARRTKIQNALDLFDEFAQTKKPLTFGGWLRSLAEKENTE